MKLLVLHGPNLNLLGNREPEVYGNLTLDEINQGLAKRSQSLDIEFDYFQSNAEHELVDRIQRAAHDQVDFLIINPAALTHTSIALRDALLATEIPFIEVHMSNVHARESFRHQSYLADIAVGTVCGFGAFSYELALLAAQQHIQHRKK